MAAAIVSFCIITFADIGLDLLFLGYGISHTPLENEVFSNKGKNAFYLEKKL